MNINKDIIKDLKVLKLYKLDGTDDEEANKALCQAFPILSLNGCKFQFTDKFGADCNYIRNKDVGVSTTIMIVEMPKHEKQLEEISRVIEHLYFSKLFHATMTFEWYPIKEKVKKSDSKTS